MEAIPHQECMDIRAPHEHWVDLRDLDPRGLEGGDMLDCGSL